MPRPNRKLHYNSCPEERTTMANDWVYPSGAEWAAKTTDGYAAEAQPSLSTETRENLRRRLEEELVSLLILGSPSAGWPDKINEILDEEESSRLLCRGPRVLTINADSGEVIMGPLP
jgi:hypothetical protein